MYTEECVMTFLKKQGQLFDEPVAESYDEAEEFLKDCFAVVVDSIKEVREYLEDEGADIEGMTDDDLQEACEVFSLPSGKYLIVEA